jgi:hypothetical protein
MGYKLRREVRDLLPAGLLTPSERLLLLEIADACNDGDRKGWPGVEWLADKCDVPTTKRVGEYLAAIARKWFELRVELGKDRHGKPFYAAPGKRTTYRVPTRTELVARHGAEKVPEIQGLDACKVPENQGAKVPKFQEGRSPKFGDPSPQLEPPKINPSSLSPREDSTSPPIGAEVESERETEEASQKPKNNKPAGTTGVLLGAGLTTDEAGSFTTWADQLPGGPKGSGWYLTLHRNGTLQERIEEWRNSGAAATTCPECDDTGQTGDWMNPRTCGCIWWKDPAEARRQWRAAAKVLPPCEHGEAGGNEEALDGWRLCALCRGPGWVARDLEPRTEASRNTGRSTSVLRAEQGLRVADEMDRAHRHGRYRPWRQPLDQSEYDRPFSGQVTNRAG